MEKQISSYWGNIDHIGLSGPAGVVVTVETHQLQLHANDPVLKKQILHITRNNGVTKLKPFLVLEQRNPEKLLRVLAIYYSPPSRELVIDIRQHIGEENFVDVLRHYKPDYLVDDLT